MIKTYTLKAFMCSGKEYTWVFESKSQYEEVVSRLKDHRHGWVDFRDSTRKFHINRAHLVSLEEFN